MVYRGLLVAIGSWRFVAASDAVAGVDTDVVRLSVKPLSSNPEIQWLESKYRSSQHRPQASPSTLSSVIHSLTAGAASRVWWGDTREHYPTQDLSAAVEQAIETPIRTGEGSHTITVYVGGQPRELIIDTGSGKTAFVCEGCDACGHNHRHEPFHFTNSTRYVDCDAKNPGDPELGGCMECVGPKCRYGQRYVEGDYWEAFKVYDEMTFSASGGSRAFKATIQFGCIYEQTGCFTEQTSDGIMGFSRHPDSIFEQFYKQQVTQSRIFAQCLAPDGGALTIGGVDMHLNRGPVAYTPLRDTGYQYWTVELNSVSIGGITLPVDRQVYNYDRGAVFDSGTTFVYLPTEAKDGFIEAWRQARGGSDDYLPVSDTFYRIDASTFTSLPSICFHFPNEARLCMGAEDYMYKMAENQYAGTIFFGDSAHSTIIGASALTHHNIIYDVDNHRIGMVEADCDAAVSALAAETMIALELHPGGDTFRKMLDTEHWTQLSLAAVAVFAVAGLVVTVWEELQRKSPVSSEVEKATTTMPASRERDDTDFAFLLMPDDE